jgi:hypothetical protein
VDSLKNIYRNHLGLKKEKVTKGIPVFYESFLQRLAISADKSGCVTIDELVQMQ